MDARPIDACEMHTQRRGREGRAPRPTDLLSTGDGQQAMLGNSQFITSESQLTMQWDSMVITPLPCRASSADAAGLAAVSGSGPLRTGPDGAGERLVTKR
jgi:hypothetical protein